MNPRRSDKFVGMIAEAVKARKSFIIEIPCERLYFDANPAGWMVTIHRGPYFYLILDYKEIRVGETAPKGTLELCLERSDGGTDKCRLDGERVSDWEVGQ